VTVAICARAYSSLVWPAFYARHSVQFFPEGTYVPAVSRRRVFTGLAVVLAAVIGLSALVGCVVTDDGFDWSLASVFGTALGTTLLALATFWLGFNTDQDVRASQDLAVLTPKTA
jgi:hypothetical protein